MDVVGSQRRHCFAESAIVALLQNVADAYFFAGVSFLVMFANSAFLSKADLVIAFVLQRWHASVLFLMSPKNILACLLCGTVSEARAHIMLSMSSATHVMFPPGWPCVSVSCMVIPCSTCMQKYHAEACVSKPSLQPHVGDHGRRSLCKASGHRPRVEEPEAVLVLQTFPERSIANRLVR